jgi:hypothetical protein
MNRSVFAGILFVALLVGGCCTTTCPLPQREQVGWTVPLEKLGITGTMARAAEPRNYDVRQLAGIAPYPHDTMDPQAAPFANGLLLADLQGPGTILRMWTGGATGSVAIFLDDMEHPYLTTPLAELFSGQQEVFMPPLVGCEGGAGYSYVPIPYAESCRIVYYPELGGTDMPYQITYATFDEAAGITRFDTKLTADDRAYLRRWCTTWEQAGDVRLHDRELERLHQTSRPVFPHKDVSVLPMDGPGTITELEMFVDSKDPAMYEKVWLQIYVDSAEEAAVSAPIGLFFGGEGNHNGLALGKEGTRMWCRYPMPFKTSVEIRLVNQSAQKLDFAYNLTWRPGPVGEALYFHAGHTRTIAQPGRPVVLRSLEGRGHLVGATVKVVDETGLAHALMGRELVWLDGQSTPVWWGTATTNFFNAPGPAEPVLLSAPSGGISAVSAQPPAVTGFRNQITDAVPYRSACVLALEHGQHNDAAGAWYEGVVYWYTDKP